MVPDFLLVMGAAVYLVAAAAAVSLVVLILRSRWLRALLWGILALPPAAYVAAFSVIGGLFWGPARHVALALERKLQVTTRIESLLGWLGHRSEQPLLRGDMLAEAQRRWPSETYPFLYTPVPEDIERPVWEDGRLIGGYDVAWLADRHATSGLLRSAVAVGLTAGVLMASLPGLVAVAITLVHSGLSLWSLVALDAPVRDLWPGDPAVAVDLVNWSGARWTAVATILLSGLASLLPALAGFVLLGFGVWLLTTYLTLRAWMDDDATPYRMMTKDAAVRWPHQAETRSLAHTSYIRQFELATGYLKDSPLLTLGTATGVFRARGDINAPLPRQPVCMDFDALFQHMIVFGGTGEGKTTALLKPLTRQLMSTGCGFYVCDAKGVLWKDVAGIARDSGRSGDVVVVGTGAEQFGVDLLHDLSPTIVASILRSALRQMSGEGGDSFWPDMAANVMRHVATVALAYSYTDKGQTEAGAPTRLAPYSLWWIYQAIILPGKIKETIDHIRETIGRDRERIPSHMGRELKASIQYLEGAWTEMAPQTRTSIIAFVSQLLDGFGGAKVLRERFACGDTGGATIRLSRALDGKIVLNALSNVEDGMPARLTSIFLKTVLYREARIREARIGSSQCRAKPCVMIADEIQEIVTADPTTGLSDATFWNVARSTGLAGVFATQTVAAIVQAIGREAAMNFLQQARSKVFFRSEDRDTAEYACWIAGQQERVRVFDEGHRESIEQRQLLDGWTPVAPLDEHAERSDRWHTLLHVAGYILSPWSVVLSKAQGNRSSYEVDRRFIPTGETRDDNGNRTSYSDAPILAALQAAHWRAEDLERQHRMHGNETKPTLTPTDMLAMGRWHAFAHVQRAGSARQDLIAIRHDFT